MKIAVVVGVYNEERHIAELLRNLASQTKKADEVIIVDDGSKDKTAVIINDWVAKNPAVKYIYQENAGPAAARNKAWKASGADVCIFTDGDCVPEKNWIKELVGPFKDSEVGATAGGYKTINKGSLLARFIGDEIAWRYSKIGETIEAHGTYNLAVRKSILEKVGGLNQEYPKPSGEDWDMTYKISKISKIIWCPRAIVGHYHPENLWWYMKNQTRRGFDRIKLYHDHPERMSGDNYSGSWVKYQVVLGGLLLPSLVFLYPIFRHSYLLTVVIWATALIFTLVSFPYLFKKDPAAALYGLPVQLARSIAWFVGLLRGVIVFGL